MKRTVPFVLTLCTLTVAACSPSPVIDAATDTPLDAEVDAPGLDAELDAPLADARDATRADRPRIDDYVFTDVVDDTDHDAGGGMVFGRLVGGTGGYPGPIAGLHYRAGAVSDVTDAMGRFHYLPGDTITFQIGDVTFRPVPARSLLSPFQIAATGTCVHSSQLANALVLVYSLDEDGDPSTGTTLPSYSTVTAARALSDLTSSDIATLIGQVIPGRTPLSVDDATDRFVHAIDDEIWVDLGVDPFLFPIAVYRGQGVATDGVDLYFSGTNGLERTDTSYHRDVANGDAIPATLMSTYGSNHIGDIDLWHGTLYAPVEDGSAYNNPLIVFYDPQILMPQPGMVFPIPHTLQTEGVPWVALNGPANELYVAEWDPTPQLNVFTADTVTLQRSLPLRPVVGRVQGAKMFDGALYFSCDQSIKSVYKVNIETGTVIHMFDLPITTENEGLAFFQRNDGSQMHTLNVSASRAGTELRHHQRTRDPLRRLVCP